MGKQSQNSGEEQTELVYRRVVAVVTALLVIGALFYLGSYFYSIVALLGVSLVMAYILVGPVGLLEQGLVKLGGRIKAFASPNVFTRALSVVVVYITFFTVMTLASVKLFPIITAQVQEFAKELPGYVTQAEQVLIDWTEQTLGPETLRLLFAESETGEVSTADGEPLPPDTVAIQESFFEKSIEQAASITALSISTALANTTTLVTGTLNGFLYTIAGFLLVFYFLMDGKRLRQRLDQMAPSNARENVNQLVNSFHQVMFAFIKGQVLLGLLTGAYMFIIYSLFGVSFSFFLGAFFAISEILPVVGTWIGITPGIIVMLFTNPVLIIPVWLCSYAFQTVKDNIIAPKIVGDVMGLHPVVVIFALIICAKAAGLVGILLALPLASILNITIHHYLGKHRAQPA